MCQIAGNTAPGSQWHFVGVIILTALGTRRICTAFPILPLLHSIGHLRAGMIAVQAARPIHASSTKTRVISIVFEFNAPVVASTSS